MHPEFVKFESTQEDWMNVVMAFSFGLRVNLTMDKDFWVQSEPSYQILCGRMKAELQEAVEAAEAGISNETLLPSGNTLSGSNWVQLHDELDALKASGKGDTPLAQFIQRGLYQLQERKKMIGEGLEGNRDEI